MSHKKSILTWDFQGRVASLSVERRFPFSSDLSMAVGKSRRAGESPELFWEMLLIFFFHRKINELVTKGAFCSLEST